MLRFCFGKEAKAECVCLKDSVHEDFIAKPSMP